MDSKDIISKLKDSKASVIGFSSFMYERVIYEMLEKFPNVSFIKSGNYSELMRYFKSDQVIRKLKLDNILEDKETDLYYDNRSHYLVIDLNGIDYEHKIGENKMYPTVIGGACQTNEKIMLLFDYFKEQSYKIGLIYELKLIFLTHVRNPRLQHSVKINSGLLSSTDLFISFTDDNIRIEKDRRYGGIGSMPTAAFLRSVKIDNILEDENSK